MSKETDGIERFYFADCEPLRKVPFIRLSDHEKAIADARKDAFSSAISAAAKVIESEEQRILSKQDGQEDIDKGLRMMAVVLPEVARKVMALTQRQDEEGK